MPPITREEKAYRLLGDAWNYFWKHCPDPCAYYEGYLDSSDFGEFCTVLICAEHVIAGGAA